jgi:tRNA (cytidine32/guanosine34-2'-O)-methyltransferase
MSFAEAFVVCQNYSPPEGFVPTMLEAYLSGEQLPGSTPPWIPFVACGDLTFDADQSYDLGSDYVRREPVQVCMLTPVVLGCRPLVMLQAAG